MNKNYTFLRRTNPNAISNLDYQAKYQLFSNFIANSINAPFPPDLVRSNQNNYTNLKRTNPNATSNIDYQSKYQLFSNFIANSINAPFPPDLAYIQILNIESYNMVGDSEEEWVVNKLNLDLSNIDVTENTIHTKHLLACELDISGVNASNSNFLNNFSEDLKPSGSEVNQDLETYDNSVDSFITFGSWDRDKNNGFIDPGFILPTNTFDSTINSESSYKFTNNEIRHILWAPPGGTLNPKTLSFPIAQIVINKNVNAKFNFVYGKGIIGALDHITNLPVGKIIEGKISNGKMIVQDILS